MRWNEVKTASWLQCWSTHQRAEADGPEVFVPDFKNSIQRGHLKNTKNESDLRTKRSVTLPNETDWPLWAAYPADRWRETGWSERTTTTVSVSAADRSGLAKRVITHLQQHLPAVHAHGVHGAEGHEGDGDGGRGVHRVIVTAQQAHETITWLTGISC